MRGSISAVLLFVVVASPLVTVRAAERAVEHERFKRPGPHAVGVRTVVLEDSSRKDEAGAPRRLVTEIWYPANESARGKQKTSFASFFGPYRKQAERVLRTKMKEIEPRFETLGVRDAPFLRPLEGPLPLLVFSHGNGGFRHQNVFQADHLASHGYLVVSPDHTGNSRLSPLPDGPAFYDGDRNRSATDRPVDVSFLIDWCLEQSGDAASWLHAAVDPKRIGVLGHSFGGFTSCRVAADDPRVRAIVPMTVAVAGLARAPAKVPTLVFLGEHDRTIGRLGNVTSRGYYLTCPAEKMLLTLKRGGHFTFCDMSILDPDFGDGVGRGRGLNGESMEFIPARLAKELINAYTLAFFDRHLRGSGAATRFLRTNHYPEELDVQSDNWKGAALTSAQGSKAAGAKAKPAGGEDPRQRVLILTGEDVPAHDWYATTQSARSCLLESGRFEVRVSEDIGILESSSIHDYDALILNFRNNYVRRDINDAAKKNLLDFVRSGKGIVGIHFAVAAFQNWPEYPQLIGKTWVRKVSGHTPRGPFTAKIARRDHPITRGLGDFEIDDELYALLKSHREVDVLVEGYSEKSKAVEPLVWTHGYGRGRVVVLALGHDVKARENPAFKTLLRQATAWAAARPTTTSSGTTSGSAASK